MLQLRIRITNCDTGLELHSTQEHIGMQGEIMKLHWEHIDDNTFQVFEVAMENGDILTLVGSEFELVSAIHDGAI